MNAQQLQVELENLTAQNEKARAEVIARIAELENALTLAGTMPEGVEVALANLKASVQLDDDMHADAPGSEPEPVDPDAPQA